MTSIIDEKLAQFEHWPSQKCLEEIIPQLQSLLAVESSAPLLNKLGYCHLQLFSFTKSDEHINTTISTLKEAFKLAGSDGDIQLKASMNLGDALYQRWEKTESADDLKNCVACRQFAVWHTSILDASFSDRLMDLADVLSAKYDESSSEADLDEATSAQRLAMLALHSMPISADESSGADTLASLLEDKFLKSRNWYALDESIIWRQKIVSTPIVRKSNIFHQFSRKLSGSLLDRYRLHQVPADLQNAIRWAKEAVSSIPTTHEEYSNTAYLLAICLQKEWDRGENLEVLKEEIEWYQESLKGLEDGDARGNHRHNLLGVALCQKADCDDSDQVQNIESAARHLFAARDNSESGSDEHVRALNNISNLYESAVNIECSLTPHAVLGGVEAAEQASTYRPESELAHYNLCKALTVQYENTASLPALDRSVELGRRLCYMSSSPRNLGLLEIALIHQFHARGSPDFLDEAVSVGLKSIRPGDPASSNKSKRLVNLANALVLRAEWKGGLEDARKDISDGIKYLQQAFSIMRTRPGGIPSGYRANLAFALLVRYDILKAEEDVLKAIVLFRECLEDSKSRESHFSTSLQSNLASAFLKLFRLHKSKEHVCAAIWHGEEALRLASDRDPRLHVRYNNLAASLQSKVAAGWGEGNGSQELARVVELLEKASKLAGKTSTAYPGYLNNLGQARINNVKRFGDPDETEVPKTIDELSEALKLVQDKGPLRGGILLNLAQAWRIKYEQGCEQEEDVLRSAIGYSREAFKIRSATLTMRIIGGYRAGIWTLQISSSREEREQAAELLREAAGLLPLLSPRDMALNDRIRNLAEFNAMDITADAVAATIDIDDKEAQCLSAFQLFETGRSVIVGNLLECRADLMDLASAHPQLAKQYEQLQEAYSQTEQLKMHDSMKVVEFARLAPATDGLDPYHLRLSRLEESMGHVLAEIRSDTAFKDFPMDTSALELARSQLVDGYVVALNASQIRCDAFIVGMGRLTSIHLKNLKYSELRKRDERLGKALKNQSSERSTARREVVEMLRWLWTVCGKPIADKIVSEQQPGTPKPRLWWMAGGVLGRLPLHACGNYAKTSPTDYECLESMQDFVVSSYIPTFKNLQLARERAAKLDENQASTDKALLVGVSTTESDGETELRSVEKEIGVIQRLLGNNGSSQVMPNPCSSEVIAALPTSRIVHFACHGISDDANPSQSYLKLPDFKTNPLSVQKLMILKLKCGFAYLSACDTAATKHASLVDESLHLVNGFLLAGCPRVVGTLWKIPDDDSVHIAAQFYDRLPWKHGHRDPSSAVDALHETISTIWNSATEKKDPLVLAAFVYFGF